MSAFLLKYPGASRNLGGVEWREEKKRGQEVFGVDYVSKLERGLMARLLIFFPSRFPILSLCQVLFSPFSCKVPSTYT